MAKILFLRILLLGLFSLPAFSDPWLSGKDEFLVKKLEYLSIKNKFSLDSLLSDEQESKKNIKIIDISFLIRLF